MMPRLSFNQRTTAPAIATEPWGDTDQRENLKHPIGIGADKIIHATTNHKLK